MAAKKNSVRTHSGLASLASKVLHDGRSGRSAKRLGGSALSNRKGTSKK